MPDYHLAIRGEGTGTPLVFLHALGASSRYWSGRLGALAATHRCVLPDLLGFGQSPKPSDCAYAISDHLDALTTTLTDQGLASEPIVLVGHSLGAILAIEYASRFPEHVRSVILLGLPRYTSSSEARTYIGAHGDWLARLVVANGRLRSARVRGGPRRTHALRTRRRGRRADIPPGSCRRHGCSYLGVVLAYAAELHPRP